ncbi:MAG: Dabb family protein [Selenomonadaceae bacterium]|nr:Dabb family protein [Selenomonadaceae bacterium]
MIRHIFIGTFKAEVGDAIKNSVLADLRGMKENIPGIVDLHADFSAGWVGSENSVVMTVDFATKADFDVYMSHPYHTERVAPQGVKYLSGYVAAQFEL